MTKPKPLDDISVSHVIETKLTQLEADAHRTLQMVGVAGNRLTNMKASHCLAAARKLRDTAELLEKAAGSEAK